MDVRQDPKASAGATALELVLVTPVLMLLLLGVLQSALLYRANMILSNATLEAARVGATENAQSEPMMATLLLRLLPLMLPSTRAASSGPEPDAQQLATLRDRTRLERLSPDDETFVDWGVELGDSGPEIPNSHLRNRSRAEVRGRASGLNLAEANLLKIRTTVAVDLNVPLIGSMIAGSLLLLDPARSEYYRRGLLPLSTSVTLRMQSNAYSRWEPSDSIYAGQEPADGQVVPEMCRPGELSHGVINAGLDWISDETSAADECGAASAAINELYALLGVNYEQWTVACNFAKHIGALD